MARIRTIKPEFWTDGDMLKLSRDARLFYIGLWNFSDDNGVMEYDPISIKARIFPNDKVSVDKLLKELVDIDKTVIYEVEKRQYIFIKNLANHQVIDRPRKSHLPLPEVNQLKSIEITLGRKEGKERNGAIKDFFDYYVLKTKKDFQLTQTARQLITKRLDEGFTLDKLKQAVDNFVQDDWADRYKHLDLIYCIGKQNGKGDNLEKWLNWKPKEAEFRKP